MVRTVSRAGICFATFSIYVLCIAGCSKGETLYPVSGKVTLRNAPLTAGIVTFIADESKGNKAKASPTGKIGSDGNYTLTTDGKSGAPLGWYKVTVNTETPGMGGPMTVDPTPGKVVPLGGTGGPQIDPKYKDSSKTTLAVEVVASPGAGAYDLKIP